MIPCARTVLVLAAVCGVFAENSTENVEQEESPVLFDMEANLRAVIDRVFKEALPLMSQFSAITDVSPDCTTALLKWVLAIRRLDPWALRMLDAMGRPPAGIFEGTITDFGAFDQCLEVRAQNGWGDDVFRGQYCSLFLKPNIDTSRPVAFLKTSKRNLTRIMKSIWFPGFRLGICVPSVCSRNDIDALVKSVLGTYGVNASVPLCDVQTDLELDRIQTAAFGLVCVALALVALGTIADVIMRIRRRQAKKTHALLEAVASWSVYGNTMRLLDVRDDGSRLRALHGVRFLTMMWIILGYSYALTPIPNRRRIFNMFDFVKHTPFMFIANAYPAADTFFCLSGFTFGYSLLKQRRRLVQLLPLLLFRRYMRVIIPGLCLLLVFSLLGVISSGPIWRDNYALLRNNCVTRWWKIPALLTNWEHSLDSCLPHLWFFAADLQLLFVFSLTLVLLVRCPKAGVLVAVSLVTAATVYVGLQTYYHGLLPVTIYFAEDVLKSRQTHTEVFKRPFAHAGAFAAGLLLSYFMMRPKGSPVKNVSVYFHVAGWTGAAACALAVIFGVEQWHKGLLPGPVVSAIYSALHKTAWGLCVAWVIFVCVTNRNGVLSRFLSWGPFVALSRLSFSAYLLHILVIFIRFGSIRERLYSSHFIQICEFIVITVLSFSGAYVFHLLFEAPSSQLLSMATSAIAAKIPKEEALPTKCPNGECNQPCQVKKDTNVLTSQRSTHL
ncbi:nose resistant to fluoxetine protein 6-like [Ornithodoros turicata]|uniref:nose resistant to fluoxetine protein 6-like n=1 Tax=Ornithodoros turicata TaxID=34597 RepID=UPI003139A225